MRPVMFCALIAAAAAKTPACGLVPGADWTCDPAVDNAWPKGAGVLNIKYPPFNAVGDGKHDDTAAFQAAVLNSTLMQSIYVPEGTYLVSKPILCKNWHSELAKGIVIQGQSPTKSIIRLADESAAFQNATNITGMFVFGQAPAQNFANLVESITISTGSRNPGAAALQFNANNEGGVFNVTLQSEDSSAAVGLDMGFCGEIGPLMVQYLTVMGFGVGVRTVHGPDSITLEHIAVYNASTAGLLQYEQDVFVRDLAVAQEIDGVPAVELQADCHHGTQLTIVDSTLTYLPALRAGSMMLSAPSSKGAISSAPAISLENSGMFARNITTTGFNASVDNNGSFPLPGNTIQEYSTNGVARPFNDSPSHSLDLPIREPPWVQLPPTSSSDWASLVGAQPLYTRASCPQPWSAAAARTNDASVQRALRSLGLLGIGGQPRDSLVFDTACTPVAVWDGSAGRAVPLPGLAPPHLRDNSCVCGSKGECYDEMAQAASSGAAVLYVPACNDGWPVGLKNASNPPVVPLGDHVTHIIGAGSRIDGYAIFDSAGKTSVPLTVMRLKTAVYGNGLITVRQSSESRPILFRSIQGLSLAYGAGTGAHLGASQKFGPVYSVDTVGHPFVVPKGAEVWSRQLNLEDKTTDIVVQGGRMWVLGLKTEKGNSGIANVTAAGELELLGVFSYATSGPYYDVPVFHANESGRLSASWGSDCFRSGDDRFQVFLREERGHQAEAVVYGNPGIFGRSGNAGFTLGTMGTGW